MKLPVVRLLAVVSVPALVFAACGDDDDNANSSTAEAPSEETALEGDITVFAAASLTDAFDGAGDHLRVGEPRHHGRVQLRGIVALREQILAGSPADVFASANTSYMDQVVDAGAATIPRTS